MPQAHILRIHAPADEPPAGTVAALVAAYLADCGGLSKSTKGDHERTLRRFAATFGARDPDSIKHSEFRAWLTGQVDWKKQSTRWSRANVVQRLFNWARLDRRIVNNPIEGLKVAKGDRRRPTTQAEYQEMLRHSDRPLICALLFWRWNGQRPQDMCNLRREWIEWKDGIPYRAVIPKSDHKSGYRTGENKVILFHPVAAQLIRRLCGSRQLESGHVFLNSHGTPWTRGALASRLRELRYRSGISKEATFHGLRHLLGTEWIAGGGSPELLAAFLGHRTSRTTMEYYVHRNAMESEILAQASRLVCRKPL